MARLEQRKASICLGKEYQKDFNGRMRCVDDEKKWRTGCEANVLVDGRYSKNEGRGNMTKKKNDDSRSLGKETERRKGNGERQERNSERKS